MYFLYSDWKFWEMRFYVLSNETWETYLFSEPFNNLSFFANNTANFLQTNRNRVKLRTSVILDLIKIVIQNNQRDWYIGKYCATHARVCN